MTREKILDMLRMIEFKDTEAHLHTWYKGIDDDMNEAVRMAIETLEAESREDAISRQAVLDLIERYNSDGLGAVFYGYEEGEKFANAIKKLPPVNPQRTDALEQEESGKKNHKSEARRWKRRYLKLNHEIEVVTHGNCMLCGKELTDGLFIYKECASHIKADQESEVSE